MKLITGFLLTGALAIPAPPAAAQTGDWRRDLDRLTDYALVLAADAIGELAEARIQSSDTREQRREREQRIREAQQRAREAGRRAGSDERYPEYKEVFTRTVKAGRSARFELDNVAGDVAITGTSGDDIRITATKSVHTPTESQGRDALRATEIEVTERSSSVTVRAVPTRGRQNLVDVDYVISVPTGTDLMIHTLAGDIQVRTVTGDVRLQATSGDITVTDVKPRDLDVTTISGDIRIEQADTERVEVESTSGDIDYRGKLARNGRYQLHSTSGDIRVAPEGGTGFDVEASTFNGDFTSDFALKLEGAVRNNFNGKGGGRGLGSLPGGRGSIRGTFNDGGASLSLRSLSGDITITKK
jgi:DUF4097 and DUF4098 domain-containing protein YvlB